MDYQQNGLSLKHNCQGNILLDKTLLPDAKHSNLFPSGEVFGDQPTRLPNSIWSQLRNRRNASGRVVANGRRRPTVLEKNDRDRSTLLTGSNPRVQLPVDRFPAKFGYQPIKLALYLVAHTYPANYVRVHFRHLGVY